MNAPFKAPRGVVYHPELIQGSEEWHAARCGLLTASEMKLILTPTLKVASNDKERAHVYELLAQRITGYVEPSYVGDNMLRGWADEIEARRIYDKEVAPVQEVGFVTNDKWGFTIGYSPDGLVGDDGLLECKSRKQKLHAQTMLDWYVDGSIPEDFKFQCQTGLLVTGRKWIDLVSYCGGMPMLTMRVEPDPVVQDAIIDAAAKFEARITAKLVDYHAALESEPRLIPTERKIESEMYV